MATHPSFRKLHLRGAAPVSARCARRRGVALLEFAFISTIFFAMLLGLIQFGLYQSTSNTLWNLSREGARFASVSKTSTTDAEIRDHIVQAAPPNISKSVENLQVNVSPATRVSGQPVTVSLTYNMEDKLIFPVVSALLNRSYKTNSTMRVE